MTGGPWTQSMKVVHGPSKVDPWSMFCPHPLHTPRVVIGGSILLNTEHTKE